jgi:hypothetical protein
MCCEHSPLRIWEFDQILNLCKGQIEFSKVKLLPSTSCQCKLVCYLKGDWMMSETRVSCNCRLKCEYQVSWGERRGGFKCHRGLSIPTRNKHFPSKKLPRVMLTFITTHLYPMWKLHSCTCKDRTHSPLWCRRGTHSWTGSRHQSIGYWNSNKNGIEFWLG